MTRLITYMALTGSLMVSSYAANADINNGKELHDSNCTSCHISMQGADGSGIYTRENKRIDAARHCGKENRHLHPEFFNPKDAAGGEHQ